MNRTALNVRRLAMCAAFTGMTLSPLALSAQSELDASEAEAYMGKWLVNIESDFGPFSMNIEIEDQDGKVAAPISSAEIGSQAVTDISRSDESLVLVFEADAQGQFFEVSLTLEREGDDLSVWFEVGGGEFSAGGIGTRQEG